MLFHVMELEALGEKKILLRYLGICLILVLIHILLVGCADSPERSLAASRQPIEEEAKIDQSLAEGNEENFSPIVPEEDKPAGAKGEVGNNEQPALPDGAQPAGERQQGEDEALRREQLGSFYVPLPVEQRHNPPVKARGIYLTGHSVGFTSRYRELLAMVEESELNSMVIDVKDDHGLMTYPSNISIVQEVEADRKTPVSDMAEVLAELREKEIYAIARIVVFKDPHLSEKKPEWAIQRIGGGLWRDPDGVAWIDPYEKQVWDYNIAIAREAALLGFREIQFDYVRFPENAHILDREAFYPAQDHLEKDGVIQEFLIHASRELAPYNVYVSADVFGVIATSWGDSDRIGQTWELISPYVDYICPMVYPSHYGRGYFGFPVPDARPAETIHRALSDCLKRNAPLESPAIIRPWLQNFTATWVQGNIPYGPREIRAQIETAYALGLDEYLLWNARNRYQPEVLVSEAASLARFRELSGYREENGFDALGRTAGQAIEAYLEAVRRGNWREAYVLQGDSDGRDFCSYPDWKDEWTYRPTLIHIEPEREEENTVNTAVQTMLVDVEMNKESKQLKLYRDRWEVWMVNNLWRVKPSPAFLELLVYDGGRLAAWPSH